MDHLPAVVVVLALQLGLVAVGQRPAQVGFADLVTVQRHLDADHGGGGVAAGEIHHHAVDGLAGHLLGSVDRIEHGDLRLLEVHDGAALDAAACLLADTHDARSEEHTSELQSLMRISYAVFCLKKKNTNNICNHRAINTTIKLET